jgi:hypothetical protein
LGSILSQAAAAAAAAGMSNLSAFHGTDDALAALALRAQAHADLAVGAGSFAQVSASSLASLTALHKLKIAFLSGS